MMKTVKALVVISLVVTVIGSTWCAVEAQQLSDLECARLQLRLGAMAEISISSRQQPTATEELLRLELERERRKCPPAGYVPPPPAPTWILWRVSATYDASGADWGTRAPMSAEERMIGQTPDREACEVARHASIREDHETVSRLGGWSGDGTSTLLVGQTAIRSRFECLASGLRPK